MKKSILSASFLFLVKISAAQTGQINIPRVAQMPNQPAPFNLRDWKKVAVQFDSFAYDLQKTGQYLPLISLGSAGINYPQNPIFRLRTYVGTNSPLGNEAINVLPSLVGATLVGANKTNQFGQDWRLMSQDFFNKNNGENLYLNNAGASSGDDWWYDLMPNLYFYQLNDLYSASATAETEAQFTTIADQFLAAVRALGGSEKPWQAGNFEYRGFKFKTMQPNPNGVHEPEAAGAFAWVLFHAYLKTGNLDYLKAAEWSLEFLSNYPSNPSYELQLPYGTYVAAKMNAEIGTKYDVEKMVNWSFNRGELRGWGTIIGTWGGLDVAGLVGEANDAGNDYAFQLNGAQQAAALVPMVRYDKRFARSIGKWMLNLANATRLFYPSFLPSNQQDAAVWSAANDPKQVVGYEALRQKYQNLSPFSTGDAVLGGWAATNLAIYGTGSIGYLGAMIESTNVDKIIKIDLLKTDFYGSTAYPTFLFFNPFLTAQNVAFDAGNLPADIYESLSETFILKNISGLVTLTIPANEAILVTICPKNGVISFQKNKMSVDGVVVDFDQHAQIYTKSPRIKGLAAAKNPIEIGDSTTVFATVDDVDSGTIFYQWTTSDGTISGAGKTIIFKTPTAPSNVEIKIIAKDLEGNADTATLILAVVTKINVAPIILEIQKNGTFVTPGQSLPVSGLASDQNGDPLTYFWSANGGSFSANNTSSTSWVAPNSEGIFEIKLKVSDDAGLFSEATTTILVKNFDTTPGNIVADYPFSSNANDVSGNLLNGFSSGAILTADQNGVPQSAYYFNGGAQHIAVANDPLLNFENAITVSFWAKANDLPQKETFLVSHGSWQNRWKISVTPDKNLRWTVNTLNAIVDLDAAAPLETDVFYHVVGTFDGSLLAIYVNGKLENYKPLSGKIRQTTFPFLMGQMLPAQVNYNFKGVLDAVKIYDYALPPGAVKALFEQGVVSTNSPILSNKKRLILSPNPVSDWLSIQRPAAGLLQVFDLAGRLIFSEKKESAVSFEMDVSNWLSGSYLVFFQSKNSRDVARFVKF